MRYSKLLCTLVLTSGLYGHAQAGFVEPGARPAPKMFMGFSQPALPDFTKLTGQGSGVQFAQLRKKESEAMIRVNQLQEQLRALNGQVEEMNFQLLQLQEQLRRMQEDNEFRFQELEGKRGGVDNGNRIARQRQQESLPGKQQPSEQESAQRADGEFVARNQETDQPRQTIDGVEIFDGQDSSGDEGILQPGVLGSLTFDENGNIVNSQIEKPIDLTRRTQSTNQSPTNVAPPPPIQPQEQASAQTQQYPDDPEQLYDLGYGYVQSGDYKLAEDVFGEFASRYPDSPKAAEASFWLGESLLAQGEYKNAARILLEAHKRHPESRMGAQTLLKLGISLAGMNQRELACATYAEVPQKYPDLSNSVREKLAVEQKAASC